MRSVVEILFDLTVNAGYKTAIKLAQLILDTTPDGIVGSITLEGLNKMEAEKCVRILMNKTVYIRAPFKKEDQFHAQEYLEPEDFDTVPFQESISEIDGEKLSKLIEKEVSKLNKEGYKVVSVTPITSGNYGLCGEILYGCSYTEGIIIVGEKFT